MTRNCIAAMHTTDELTAFLHTLADLAGAKILPLFRHIATVENKDAGGFDPVTVADRAAEEVMRAAIAARFPEDGIFGEEYGVVRNDAEAVWILDPIDGTRAFIAGLPTWGVLIGRRSGGRATHGLMAQPYVGERFWGDGRTAFWSGPTGTGALKTRACADLASALTLTTSPTLFTGPEAPPYERIARSVRHVRFGTDCYGYAMVAAGQADLCVECGLKTYDIAALIPIIEGAGGTVTNWTGGSALDGGQVVASGDPRVHEAALKLLAQGA